MRVLFDKSAPNGLARHLQGHAVSTAEQCGWGRLENGDLLTVAEESGYELFLTADKNLRYQQNFAGAENLDFGARSVSVAACARTHPGNTCGG